ncbi:unnamed protein product, partial [Prorocentrum cordatum]
VTLEAGSWNWCRLQEPSSPQPVGSQSGWVDLRRCVVSSSLLLVVRLLVCRRHPPRSEALTSLGNAYGRLGDFAKQLSVQERALKIKEKFYGADHHSVARTLAGLGCAYGRLGDVTKQRQLLERALGVQEAFYGPDHAEAGWPLGGSLCHSIGYA